MMGAMTDSQATSQTIDAFDQGGDHFAAWTPLLWDPIGAATVALAPPRPGEKVLDVCCGTGSSAIPAARRVGETGSVDAIDLSTSLLEHARARAADLPHLRFHHADATGWTGGPYDRFQCVFGVFFLPDMDADTRRLIGLVRPGGAVTITTWRENGVQDVVGSLFQAITDVTGVTLPPKQSHNAAARVDSEDKLAGWLTGLGLRDVAVHPVDHDAPLTPDSAWDFLMGSAARTAFADKDEDTVAAIRARYRELMASIPVFRARALVGTGTV
ncbi:2-methoxy-6-polyprenyl-1,4-benzoquinol methylase, mitochondrial [Actinosynnema sp. ALI-1.44]